MSQSIVSVLILGAVTLLLLDVHIRVVLLISMIALGSYLYLVRDRIRDLWLLAPSLIVLTAAFRIQVIADHWPILSQLAVAMVVWSCVLWVLYITVLLLVRSNGRTGTH